MFAHEFRSRETTMSTSFANDHAQRGLRRARGQLICALLAIAVMALPAGRADAADALAKGAKDYKPFAVERIEIALDRRQGTAGRGEGRRRQGGAGGLDQVAQRLGSGRADHRRILPQARRGDRCLARRQAGLSRDRGRAVCRQARRGRRAGRQLVADLDRIPQAGERARLQVHPAGPAQRRHQARLRNRRKQIQGRRIALCRHLDQRHLRKQRRH